jgi:tripartite-type tricarboxylate transporter receptor subunit TctC
VTATLAVPSPTSAEVLELPLVASSLPGYEARQWYASRDTPPEIVDRLNREINAALADATARARLADLGGMIVAGAPADFGRLIADETVKWAKVVRFSGAKAG